MMKYSTVVLLLGQIVALIDRSLPVRGRMVPSTGTSPLAEALENGRNDTAIPKGPYPTNKRRVVLMCRNHNYLIMKETGRLTGTKNPKTIKKFGKFELQVYGIGVVRIFNLRTRKYIAIDKKGKAYATRALRSIDTLLKETEKHNFFHTYHSYYHRTVEKTGTRKWYLAIKKDGRLKRPSKTLAKHRSIEFLARDYKKYKSQLIDSR